MARELVSKKHYGSVEVLIQVYILRRVLLSSGYQDTTTIPIFRAIIAYLRQYLADKPFPGSRYQTWKYKPLSQDRILQPRQLFRAVRAFRRKTMAHERTHLSCGPLFAREPLVVITLSVEPRTKDTAVHLSQWTCQILAEQFMYYKIMRICERRRPIPTCQLRATCSQTPGMHDLTLYPYSASTPRSLTKNAGKRHVSIPWRWVVE